MNESIEFVRSKIIILSLMRDAIKQVSPQKVFRSMQHRDELYHAIIEALEILEDKLEELEEAALKEEEKNEEK